LSIKIVQYKCYACCKWGCYLAFGALTWNDKKESCYGSYKVQQVTINREYGYKNEKSLMW